MFIDRLTYEIWKDALQGCVGYPRFSLCAGSLLGTQRAKRYHTQQSMRGRTSILEPSMARNFDLLWCSFMTLLHLFVSLHVQSSCANIWRCIWLNNCVTLFSLGFMLLPQRTATNYIFFFSKISLCWTHLQRPFVLWTVSKDGVLLNVAFIIFLKWRMWQNRWIRCKLEGSQFSN